MTKRNLIITIILLSFIDLVAAGWYVSQRIEASGKSQDLFNQRDSTDYVAEADTVTLASEADLFDELQHNTYYYIANSPSITGDNSSRYTSIKHVKVRWPRKVNGDSDFSNLNKGRSDDKKLQHALNVPAEICCTKKGVLFQYKHGTIFSTPVEVLIEYNKLEPFFTEEFKQLLKANDDYKVYDNHIKPEPINPVTATKTAFVSKPAAATTTSAKKSSNSYYKRQHKHQYNHQYKRQYKRQYNRQYKQQNQYVKPRYKSQKRYSGAKRKSGRYGYAGKRSWSRRRR